jgi:transcriptional regulator with XRE-family HTH domain
LGEYLEAERVRMRYSRAAFADAVGYSAGSIYEIERMGQPVSAEKLVEILRKLEVPEVAWPMVLQLPRGRVAERRADVANGESDR